MLITSVKSTALGDSVMLEGLCTLHMKLNAV